MRLVAGLFAMFLTASVAQADEVKAPDPKPEVARSRVALRVVRVMPESHQALLFDKDRGTHVLADVGGTVGAYRVEEIDDDSVTLSADGKEIVLAAPAREWRRGDRRQAAQPADPYGAGPVSVPAANAPVDPYDDGLSPTGAIAPGQGGVRVASATAPADPYQPDGVRTASAANVAANPYDDAPEAPVAPVAKTEIGAVIAQPMLPAGPALTVLGAADGATAAARKPAAVDASGFLPPGTSADDAATFKSTAIGGTSGTVKAVAGSPTSSPGVIAVAPSAPAAVVTEAPRTVSAADVPAADAAADAAPAAPVITPTVLSRSQLNTAIADIGKLTNLVRGSFTPDGARLDAVAEGSVFAAAGLRRGDMVTAVDGKPLRSLDDAADLYVRAASTKAANISVIRNGQPLTLRVLIQ